MRALLDADIMYLLAFLALFSLSAFLSYKLAPICNPVRIRNVMDESSLLNAIRIPVAYGLTMLMIGDVIFEYSAGYAQAAAKVFEHVLGPVDSGWVFTGQVAVIGVAILSVAMGLMALALTLAYYALGRTSLYDGVGAASHLAALVQICEGQLDMRLLPARNRPLLRLDLTAAVELSYPLKPDTTKALRTRFTETQARQLLDARMAQHYPSREVQVPADTAQSV